MTTETKIRKGTVVRIGPDENGRCLTGTYLYPVRRLEGRNGHVVLLDADQLPLEVGSVVVAR